MLILAAATTAASGAVQTFPRDGWGGAKISQNGKELTFRNCRFDSCSVAYRSAIFWATGGNMRHSFRHIVPFQQLRHPPLHSHGAVIC